MPYEVLHHDMVHIEYRSQSPMKMLRRVQNELEKQDSDSDSDSVLKLTQRFKFKFFATLVGSTLER